MKNKFLNKITPILFTLIIGLCISCNENKTTKATSNTVDKETSHTENHFLENDGIQIELPKNFARYSSAKYEALLSNFIKGPDLELEQKHLSHLRKIDGNLYIYFDDKSNSTITLNTFPYQPITKDDAKAILADIVRDQTETSKNTKKEFTKLSSNYSDGKSAQVLKSVFSIKKKKEKKPEQYQHKYYISSKDKYIIIEIRTPLELDFDPYLEKISFNAP